MSRARTLTLVALVGLALLAGVVLVALPEVVRRVAVDRISEATGRVASIADVDLNLFTGRLVVKGFRMADREGPEAFVEVERLDVRVGILDLLRRHVRIRELALIGPSIRAARLESRELTFADLLAGGGERAPEAEAAGPRWRVTVEQAGLTRGRIRFDDRGVSPPTEWLVQDLDVEARDLTTQAGATPGRLDVRAQVNEARIELRAEPLRLAPFRLAAKVSLEGFLTHRLNAYIYGPAGAPYRARGAQFGLALTLDVDSDAEEVRTATAAGTLTLDGEGLVQVGRPDPFFSASRIRVEVKEADMIARTLAVARVDLERLEIAARRDVQDVIDLVEMFTPAPAPKGSAAPPPAATGPSPPPARRTLFPIIRGLAGGFTAIRVERAVLTPSSVTFLDEGVKPTTRLVLSKLEGYLDDLTWPVKGPATLALSAGLPGGGTVRIKGPLTVHPFDAELVTVVRDAPVEPYQAYIPVPARLSGRFNGDSRNRIAFRNGGLLAQSKGDSWGERVEIREPGSRTPAIRVERMDLRGIDFDWPRRATARTASFRRPRVEIERAADGSINLRRLFTPTGDRPAERAAPPPAAVPKGESKNPLDTMRLEIGEVRIDDGFVRFLDRTTQPAFAQDVSRLDLTVTDLGNRKGRRARLALQGVVGGDGALDVRGEIGAIGEPAYVDLVGELRRFDLTSVDPYAAPALGWVIRQGELQHRLRFKLDGGQLTADNDVVIGQLQVAPARGGDEVKQRIGLPLGLIVALVKDQRGEIRVNVPVTGAVSDPKFSLGNAIWTAVKNTLVNVVAAPFKAIGGLFSSKGTGAAVTLTAPTVDPVTFAAGSAVLAPAMEEHLGRVADYLRRSPFVNLALAAAPAPADADALAGEALAARLAAFRKERALPDLAAALAEYYAARLPGVPLPATTEEQIALLRRREPAPDALLADLGRRRVDATRERLLAVEGIPASRLEAATAPPTPGAPASPAVPGPDVADGGRVEFTVVAGE